MRASIVSPAFTRRMWVAASAHVDLAEGEHIVERRIAGEIPSPVAMHADDAIVGRDAHRDLVTAAALARRRRVHVARLQQHVERRPIGAVTRVGAAVDRGTGGCAKGEREGRWASDRRRSVGS